MSIDPPTAEQPTAPRVATVVSASDPALLHRCLEAIERQVYESARVFVVGGDDEIRHLAGQYEATWRPSLRAVVSSIGPEFTFVWALREAAIPHPQALRTLVQDSIRVGAAVAGSKVVDAEHPEELVAVGYATDAFDSPYSGLQPDEVDQAQYDVIRDVAAVSGVAVLIRRDLYRGLGGIDRSMTSTPAAIDFCQRARLRGGRVVVIPGSVVAYDGTERIAEWKERAGEIRAMIKSYSALTLLWTLPLTLLIGLIEGVARIPFGRFPLPGVAAAWLWNVVHLPTALRQRFQARRGREAGDEELFRYQVVGSARLRLLWDDTMLRVRDRFPEGILSGFSDAVEAGQQRIRHPAFFVGSLVVLFGLVATREVWTQHLPVVGFSLPPPDSAVDTLRAYAGGWNPAGLGSPEALRPDVGAVALVQLIAFGSGGLAVALIVLGSFLLGSFGVGRLLRVWGIGSIAGYLAGTVLMAGPAMVAATSTTRWGVIAAAAALPWAVRAALVPAAESRGRVAAVAGGVLSTGVVAVFVPAALIVPLIALGLWSVFGVGKRFGAVGRGAVATVLAIPFLLPWALYTDPIDFLKSGSPAYWNTSWMAVAAITVAALGGIFGGGKVMSSVAAWGAGMAAVGAVLSRSGDLGLGQETLLAGLVLNAFGVAIAAGAGLEVMARRKEYGGLKTLAALGAGLGALGLIIGTVVLAGPGRGGIPDDGLTGTFDFAAAPDAVANRVLLFGAADTLPGTSRDIDGIGYRVFIAPYPQSWEAFLNEERLGDDALRSVLTDLIDGRTRRAGAALSDFGIGWVAFTDASPLQAVFESQLDLVALRSLHFPVFRNESSAAVARSTDGVAWEPDGSGFRAPPGAAGGDVTIAANADFRWGPGEWSQSDWANSVAASGPEVFFAPYGPRRWLAIGAGLWLIVAAVAWWSPRLRGRDR